MVYRLLVRPRPPCARHARGAPLIELRTVRVEILRRRKARTVSNCRTVGVRCPACLELRLDFVELTLTEIRIVARDLAEVVGAANVVVAAIGGAVRDAGRSGTRKYSSSSSVSELAASATARPAHHPPIAPAIPADQASDGPAAEPIPAPTSTPEIPPVASPNSSPSARVASDGRQARDPWPVPDVRRWSRCRDRSRRSSCFSRKVAHGCRARTRPPAAVEDLTRLCARTDSMVWPRGFEWHAGVELRRVGRSVLSGRARARPTSSRSTPARSNGGGGLDLLRHARCRRRCAGWAHRTPDDFIFALKLPQEITHERRLRNVDDLAAEFFDRARELGDEAGPDSHPARSRFRSDGAAGGRAVSSEAAARHPVRHRVPAARLDSRWRAGAARRAQRRADAERRALDSAQADDAARDPSDR